ALDRDGESLGTLVEILATAGVDVLVVRGEGGDLLLPATASLIVRLDRERRELWLDPPPELLAEAAR
ncbi:MAG TPA: ribosome maturation factor RimM, partial [Myxococcota bacterium]|nr:ribosome maturation factor RimM [Myxococcota bacterium]